MSFLAVVPPVISKVLIGLVVVIVVVPATSGWSTPFPSIVIRLPLYLRVPVVVVNWFSLNIVRPWSSIVIHVSTATF